MLGQWAHEGVLKRKMVKSMLLKEGNHSNTGMSLKMKITFSNRSKISSIHSLQTIIIALVDRNAAIKKCF